MKNIYMYIFIIAVLAKDVHGQQVKNLVLEARKLPRSTTAQHVGDGDEELKRIETTHLTGTFSLRIQDGRLIGELTADFKEIFIRPGNKVDDTEFVVNTIYDIYAPEAGYKITSFKILYDTKKISSFDVMGRTREQIDVPLNGPLSAIYWVGDTGIDRDQIFGCFIVPHLKRLSLIIERQQK